MLVAVAVPWVGLTAVPAPVAVPVAVAAPTIDLVVVPYADAVPEALAAPVAVLIDNEVAVAVLVALGSLHSTAALRSGSEDRVRMALEAASALNAGVRGPFHIETLA